MSIAVLNHVYDEARRLAVAGSVVARGDFRLKKLVGPLEQAGAKAPVFAKVAEAAKAVVDGPEEASAGNLLELASLVTAVLYTQGETGCPGTLEPIETTDLVGTTAPTSARLLKPLLEALTSTGSGRLELVRDAHQRGVFRDLRLVLPALDGLDDPYPEIADFLAENVIPLYGKAVLPILRGKYDPKGTKGHPRRIKLLHALDPAGTRELVTQALEAGSKEVRVAAVECLGAEKGDLAVLIEQASAKAKEVREAAYRALARVDDPAAAAVLGKALGGADYLIAAAAAARGDSPALAGLLVEEVRRGVEALPTLKDKKQVSQRCERIIRLIDSLPTGDHKGAEALLLDLFARRAELSKIKGPEYSGADLVSAAVRRMGVGSEKLRTHLARSHAQLTDDDELGLAVRVGREVLPPAELYDLFSPYLTSKVNEKKKGQDPAWVKRQAVITGLDGGYFSHLYGDNPPPPLDPRWLDLAARQRNLDLVRVVGRPGHTATEAFLQEEFDAALKKAKPEDDLRGVVALMVQLNHPRAADALVAAFEKTIGKTGVNNYWYYHLITDLPKSAVPKLEAVVPKLKGQALDRWVREVQELREKT